MTDEPKRTDDDVIRDCIESMKAGCGCVPYGLPRCNDKRCPNSPEWAGLIQFGWPNAPAKSA